MHHVVESPPHLGGNRVKEVPANPNAFLHSTYIRNSNEEFEVSSFKTLELVAGQSLAENSEHAY